MAEKRNKPQDYKDYFENRTVADIMGEWSDHQDEWKPVGEKEEDTDKNG